MVKIYTGSGDEGETSLLGGTRTSKSDLRVEAYGSVDELNGLLGVIRARLDETDVSEHLKEIQSKLFVCGAELAREYDDESDRAGPLSSDPITQSDVRQIEDWIDQYDEELPTLQNFLLPGGTDVASLLHFARSVCRRAERQTVRLFEERDRDEEGEVLTFLNRLSDFLFVLARTINVRNDQSEVKWSGKSSREE